MEESGQDYEGHLVAHIKVSSRSGGCWQAPAGQWGSCSASSPWAAHCNPPLQVPPTYFEAQQQSPAGSTPHSLSRSPSDTDAQAAGASGGSGNGASGGAGMNNSSSAPTTPQKLPPVSPHEIASLLLPGAGAGAAAAAGRAGGVSLPTSPGQLQQQPQSPPPLSSSESEVIRHASDSLAAAMATPLSTPPYK